MKNKRISTRVLAVFAAVLLIMTLSVPTFAATSYTFSVIDYDGEALHVCYSPLPQGLYYLEFDGIRTSSPINVIYDSTDGPPTCIVDDTFDFGVFSKSATVSIRLDGTFVSGEFVADRTLVGIVINDRFMPFEGLMFIPAESEIVHLSDYVPVDTLPTVFNEIISLLPLALGALIGFIAIRKGIAYLQNFLHSS